MNFALVSVLKANYSVSMLCDVLELSPSGYYAWRRRGQSSGRRLAGRATRHEAMRQSFLRSKGRYGSPRVHRDLRSKGLRVSRRAVAEFMRREGLCARKRRPFKATTDSKHVDPIAPNLLDRNFTVVRPNVAWVGDVTAIATTEGWLFLAVLIDLHSRRVVGWSTSTTNDTPLALAALEMARSTRRPGPGLVHHTDRGSPYTSKAYQDALTAFRAVSSMSRKGNCWDNAAAESFFSSAKTELGITKPLASLSVANAMIKDYIDAFYNTVRLHSTNDFMSPIYFELTSHFTSLAA